MHTTTIRRLAAGALVLSLALTGCGDDDEPTAAADDTTTTAPEVSEAACDAAIEVSGLLAQAPQDPEAIKGFAADTAVPAATKLAEALPADLREHGEAIKATFEGIAETGDPSGIESPEYTEASLATGAMVHEDCGLPAVEVGAHDYRYSELPKELEAGLTSFALENHGEEPHEMVLFKRAEGETRGWAELSQLPEEEQMGAMQFSGVAFGDPGSTAYTAVELEAGTYFVACFIPVGGGEEGAPHFTEGMVQEVTVS